MKKNCYLVTELSASHIRMLGRSYPCVAGLACDFSATGAIFALRCAGETTVEVTFSTDANVYFTVYVDGIRQDERLFVNGGGITSANHFVEQTVTVCTLPAGEHTVRLVRQSNLWHARTSLVSISTEGEFLPAPAPRARTFEFIGDSLTCGYGVTPDAPAAPREIAGTAQFCDATQSFAFLTAEALDAEATLCGYSGWGLTWGENEIDPVTEEVRVLRAIPQVYPYQSHKRGDTLYTPTKAPDLVVINLGSNDHSHRNQTHTDDVVFTKAVKDFMLQVRAMYGKDMPIVQAYGQERMDFADAIKEAVAQLGGAAGGVYFCELPKNREGGNGHPTAAGQREAADVLIAFLREKGLV